MRFLTERHAAGGRPRLRCHVYAGETGLFHAPPTWVWWSPVLESPEEFRTALRAALRAQSVRRA